MTHRPLHDMIRWNIPLRVMSYGIHFVGSIPMSTSQEERRPFRIIRMMNMGALRSYHLTFRYGFMTLTWFKLSKQGCHGSGGCTGDGNPVGCTAHCCFSKRKP